MADKPTINLSGEQAEVFNEQMDTDRKLMEATDDFIAFRPAIEGEWNEGIMLGYDLHACASSAQSLILKDLGRRCAKTLPIACLVF